MKIILVLFFVTFSLYGTNISGINAYITPTQEKTVIDDEFENEFEEEEKLKVVDPLIGYNRAMTSFNDIIYMNVLIPVSTGYSKVLPQEARKSISNVCSNLLFPVRFVNNVLQFKFANALEETGRFLINSTVGFLGLFDIAKNHYNIEAHNEDFGQTLGFYGVKPGPHLVLPLFGPSNLRDAVSIIPDAMLNPTNEYFHDLPSDVPNSLALNGLYYINKSSLHLGEYESLKKDSIDLYLFLRDSYEQHRLSEIGK